MLNIFIIKRKVKERIVLSEIYLRTTGRHLSMGSATRQRGDRPAFTPTGQIGSSIYRPRKDERLSWLSWLVTYRDGLPVHRRCTHPGTNRV